MIGLLTDVHPSDASWTTLTSLPEASFGSGAASQGGRLYLVGGFTNQITPNVVAWNGTVWGTVTPMSQARMTAGVAATQASVFAFGGLDANGVPSATAERLDPGAGTWSDVAAMPMARASGAAGAIGESLYVAGGQGDDGQPLAASFRFDPAANVWSSIAALPTPRTGVAGAVLSGRLWVIGGFDGMPSSAVERFDPGTGSWSSGPALPEPLWFPAAGVLDGRVWVAGGMDGSFMRSDRVYSAGNDGVWRSEEALPAPLAVASVGSLDHCLVVAGGMDVSGMPSAMAFSQCVAPPPPPPPPPPGDTLTVAITLNPTTLNASSNGQWISAHIVPAGFAATDILIESLRLDGVAPDLTGPVSVTSTDLSVKFPRAAFSDRPSGVLNLTLTGLTTDSRSFSGSTSLSVQGSSLASKKRGLKPLPTGAVSGVEVTLDRTEPVRIDVIDLQGRIVARLYQGLMTAGQSRHEWPRAGQSVARGTYFVRLARSAGTEVVRIAVTH
jgi:hypothetical protein